MIYAARFAGAVVVLHCFRKTTQKTALADIATAKRRYADFVQEFQR